MPFSGVRSNSLIFVPYSLSPRLGVQRLVRGSPPQKQQIICCIVADCRCFRVQYCAFATEARSCLFPIVRTVVSTNPGRVDHIIVAILASISGAKRNSERRRTQPCVPAAEKARCAIRSRLCASTVAPWPDLFRPPTSLLDLTGRRGCPGQARARSYCEARPARIRSGAWL